jgi:hypothetical protein
MTDTDTNAPASRAAPPRRGATVRLAQRELSIISLAVVAFMIGVLGFLGYRAMMGFKASHDLLIAKQNLHMLHEAFYNYAQDWDQQLPPADRWTDSIAGYLSSSGQPGGALASLHGPGDGKAITYVLNDLAAGFNIESNKTRPDPGGRRRSIDQSRLILLIERPGAGSNEHVTIPPQTDPTAEQALLKELAFPHGSDDTDNAATVVLYADGTQRQLTRRDLRQ